jgi:hypothetical protein
MGGRLADGSQRQPAEAVPAPRLRDLAECSGRSKGVQAVGQHGAADVHGEEEGRLERRREGRDLAGQGEGVGHQGSGGQGGERRQAADRLSAVENQVRTQDGGGERLVELVHVGPRRPPGGQGSNGEGDDQDAKRQPDGEMWHGHEARSLSVLDGQLRLGGDPPTPQLEPRRTDHAESRGADQAQQRRDEERVGHHRRLLMLPGGTTPGGAARLHHRNQVKKLAMRAKALR